MSILEILFIGIALSMDAFAIAICKGLAAKKVLVKSAIIIALYFGFFQAFMPIVGFYLGNYFQKLVINIAHWIAFILLSFLGGNMIRHSGEEQNKQTNPRLDFKTMLLLSLATSIDALTIGVTLSFLKIKIFFPAIIIGSTTFIFSFLGVLLGNTIGKQFQAKTETIGGIILIIIGLKVLLEHLV